MTIEEKYLELRKKAVNRKLIDTCSPTCTLKTDQNLAYIVLFKRKDTKCAEYFTTHFQYGFRYAVHLKKLCMPHEKSLKYAWEPRNGDCGRLDKLSAIFRENNHSSMTSQPSLRSGIFRTDERIFQLLIIYIVHPRLVFRFRENRSKRCRTISISKHQTRVCLRRLDDRKRIKLTTKIAKIMPSSY